MPVRQAMPGNNSSMTAAAVADKKNGSIKLSCFFCILYILLQPFSSKEDMVSGCSVVRSSRLVWDQEVASSNLAIPTKCCRSLIYSIFCL